LGESCEC